MAQQPLVRRESEVQDRGLFEGLWQLQQIKTFTAWCNSHLRKAGMAIEDIGKDFGDGLKLIKLLEIIASERLSKPEKVKFRIHKITNLNIALDFIKTKGVKLVGIGAEEICDDNLKMILGMIWTIILRFQIQDISVEELSAKEGLLLWCQKKTAGYKNVNVQNFHTSFQDGLAFCALIHRHRPDLIDFDSLSKENPEDNLNLAFEVADKHLDIPKMLDAKDMLSTAKPDERSVMTYVAAYYHAFSSYQKSEAAARRLAKVLATAQENQKLMDEYDLMASNLLAWIAQTRQTLGDRSPLSAAAAAQKALADYRAYKKGEKPPKAEEKAVLEAHYSTLQTKLRLSGRPPYVPSEGKLVSDIHAAWKALDTEESAREMFLRAELVRLERLERLAQKFAQKAAIHERWSKGKDVSLSSTDYGDSLGAVQNLKKQHDAFVSDFQAHESRYVTIQEIAAELGRDGYTNQAEIAAKAQEIEENWNLLTSLSNDRKAKLDESERHFLNIDNLHLEFAKRATAFSSWTETISEDLLEVAKAPSVEVAKEYESNHAQVRAGVQEQEAEFNAIIALDEQLRGLTQAANPYTSLSIEALTEKWNEVSTLLASREESISAEVARQESNEQLRIAFADKANSFSQFIADQRAGIQNASGSSEEQLESLKARQKEISEHRTSYEELEATNLQVDEALIFENPHTPYTMETISVEWEQLQSLIKKTITAIQNQIMARDGNNISEELLNEYRTTFAHFDKDSSGYLDRLEFRACLMSLGRHDLPELIAGQDDPVFDKIMAVVDPEKTGSVQFDAFVDLMSKEDADKDSADQIKESFKIIAGDKDYVTSADLRRDLSPEQAAFCMAHMQPYPGVEDAYDYKTFTDSMYSA
eukprot:Colp12_sorted_trinity150504_noHs@23769